MCGLRPTALRCRALRDAPGVVDQDGDSRVKRNLKSACPFLSPTTTDPNVLFDTCFVDDPLNDTDTISACGHGTHVAGIAAGGQVNTTAGDVLFGAAPWADILVLIALLLAGLLVRRTLVVRAGK